jgi:hypothetical protein
VAGFIRRYSYFPGVETITAIEGVIIVDLPPPGSIQGVGAGTVCCIGEFADMTYGTTYDSTGTITTKPQPVEIFSGQDLADKAGGFDETIGSTGIAGGSGFLALRNKTFSRLVIVPVNLASNKGVRLYRDLPTNKSATDPTPVVLLQAATVAAGREFKLAGNRVRVGARKVFTALGQYEQGIDGAITAAGAPAATQTFGSATGAFLTSKNGGPVQKGDLLVLGVIGGVGALGANAATYRVATTATVATQLVVEKLDGSTFDWTTGIAQPWRVHPSTDADTGGIAAVEDVNGYIVPARPLDSAIAADQALAPTIVPPAGSATGWDPLSGLHLRTIPTAGLSYTATVQAANAVNDATIDALYAPAFDALLSDDLPGREVNILVAARHSSTIRTKGKAHVLQASQFGIGRRFITSPELSVVATSAAIADADPGVGANRTERIDYSWPGVQTFVPEAVGFNMMGADGIAHADGMIDTHADMWLAAVESNLPPERNPAQAAAPVPDVLATVVAFQRGVSSLTIGDYIALRSKGVCAMRFDRTTGPGFQSGVTTSLLTGEKNIFRRRMADFIEDSLSQSLVQFAKLPLTNSLKDSEVGQVDAFLAQLLSANNPAAQRIDGYLIDDKSGNTPANTAAGIFVIIAKVRLTPTQDFLLIQCSIGESVSVTAT